MAGSPLSGNRFLTIFSISWLLLIADHFFLLRWYGLSWQTALVDCLVNDLILLMVALLILKVFRYYLPRNEGYIYLVGWCLFLTAVIILLSKLILKNIFIHNEDYRLFLDRSLIVRASLDFLLTGCIILISVVWYNWQEQKEQETMKQDAEKLAREAELFKLRQQLQPHFLFNSLNSINALIGIKPDEARRMVQQLSDFLRGTIRKEEHQWVSLKEELHTLQLYLNIEKVRFGNRLSAAIECDNLAEKCSLPVLLLQPLMENAIKFGLYDTTDEITITLKASVEENNLVITVINPFDPETSPVSKGTGFGLQSIQRRLYLLFARNDLLITEAKENIFTTTVRIPQASATALAT
jgi:sensor histidine kinase YesM